MGTFIQWKNFEALLPYANMFKEGLITTVLLALFTVLIGFVLGLLLSVMRMSNIRPFLWLAHAFPDTFGFFERDRNGMLRDSGFLYHLGRFNPLSFLATAYVEVIRGIPLLVQLFYIYYALSRFFQISGITSAVIAISVCYGAYMGEVFRAGILSVPKGQTEAARSLGFNNFQTMTLVILPQAMRTILPPIGNECIAMLKDTSLVSIIAVADLLRRGREFASQTFDYFETYTVIALVYLIITLLLSKGVSMMEGRLTYYDRDRK